MFAFARKFAQTSVRFSRVQFHSGTQLVSIRQFSSDIQDVAVRYKRALFHSQQRGWLELDLIIGSFVRLHKDAFQSHAALDKLEQITDEDNSDLIRWLVEGKEIPEKYADNEIMTALKEYSYSPDKPWYPKAGNQ